MDAFNSLCEILDLQIWLSYIYCGLSILFVRFLDEEDNPEEGEGYTFNSLCEIPKADGSIPSSWGKTFNSLCEIPTLFQLD